jgi:hypothetical protein
VCKRGVHGQGNRDEREADLAGEQETPPVDGIRERAADDRRKEQRGEGREREQADLQRRVRQLVELVRDGDPRDLACDEGDRLAEEEASERRRLAKRRQVERDASEQAADPRRRQPGRFFLSERLGARQLLFRHGRGA